MVNRPWSTTLLVALALTASSCSSGNPAPSIVLISIDTLRADHLSAYGYERPTVNIDALAASGVLFEEAHSVAPWTLPAHMTMMTGRFPSSHAVVNDGFALEANVPTLAEALTRNGYRAAGFVAHHYLSADYGFDRGFDDGYLYQQYLNDRRNPAEAVRGNEVVGAAINYLERTKGDETPYFLFVHLFDAHWTYSAPPPYAGRYSGDYEGPMDGTLGRMMPAIATKKPLRPEDRQQLINLYDEEIAFLDDLVGRLAAKIRSLPGGERTVIVLTADHGEEFEDHGTLGHSITLYREQTHIPLIVSDPSMEQEGRRIPTPVRSVDLASTIGRIAGLPEDDPFLLGSEGVPLQIHLTGEEAHVLPVVIETTRYGHPRAAAVIGGHKAIAPMDYDWVGILNTPEGPKPRAAASWRRGLELYDIEQDPLEQSPLTIDLQNDAIVFLREWQERTWRGLQLTVRPEEGWRLRMKFPRGTIWFDEAWIDDGTRSRRLEIENDLLELGNLPPGLTYRIGLPMFIEPGEQLLTIEGLASQAVFLFGREEQTVGAGQTHRLDLSRSDLRASGSMTLPADGQARIRSRPRNARAEAPPIDPEVEKILKSLGYVGR